MDEFAQTRGVDDLFDDDIIPVALQHEPVHEPDLEADTEQNSATQPPDISTGQSLLPAQTEHELSQQPEPAALHHRKRGGSGRSRGRGNGFSRRLKPEAQRKPQNIPLEQAAVAQVQPSQVEPTQLVEAAPSQDAERQDTPPGAQVRDDTSEGEQGAKNGQLLEDETQVKEAVVVPKVPAVRGDRSGTGGVRKPKLTEEELSERMAAAKITAAKKAAAHARAEADEASFQEREKIALAKRLEERQNRRVMLSEREKNRQRKLNSQTGREWDAEKSQDLFSERGKGGSAYRRGAHGGVVNDMRTTAPLSSAELDNSFTPSFGDRGRGRGGRGGRSYGRRGAVHGAGRGVQQAESLTAEHTNPMPPPEISTYDDFPSLPNADEKIVKHTNLTETQTSDLLSPAAPSGTWADQVEISEALEKKTE